MTALAANKPDKAENHMSREFVYRKVCGRILAQSGSPTFQLTKNSERVIFLSFSATFPSFKKVLSVLLCTAPPIFLPEAGFLLADSLVMSRVVNEGGVVCTRVLSHLVLSCQG
jgi:hypothetical protein